MELWVEFISYIAWPVVVLIGLFYFRKELGLLIGRIEEYQHGNKRLVFSNAHKQGGARELPVLKPTAVTEKPAQLSKEATRILATLWNGQKRHFKDDFTGRWSFRVLPNAHEYGEFMLGFSELLRLGLIGWTRKDGQALLTDKGVEYLKNHPEIQESADVYGL